uniref:Uncharacterized protein n=1 Tax=Caenorhabditis tropicalis TaxID=1561998 RepID=A0A1I7TLE5_9PELO
MAAVPALPRPDRRHAIDDFNIRFRLPQILSPPHYYIIPWPVKRVKKKRTRVFLHRDCKHPGGRGTIRACRLKKEEMKKEEMKKEEMKKKKNRK